MRIVQSQEAATPEARLAEIEPIPNLNLSIAPKRFQVCSILSLQDSYRQGDSSWQSIAPE